MSISQTCDKEKTIKKVLLSHWECLYVADGNLYVIIRIIIIIVFISSLLLSALEMHLIDDKVWPFLNCILTDGKLLPFLNFILIDDKLHCDYSWTLS